MSDQTQKRIVLWTVPRCAGSAFYRAMINRPRVKGFNEAYFGPYYMGPEKISQRFSAVNPDFTFQSVTSSLEEAYPEYDTLFVKEGAFVPVQAFKEKAYDNLPKGYRHTFMIRNPKYSVTSLYSVNKLSSAGWNTFEPTEVGFKESLELARQIKARSGENPIVLDTGDLMENPEGMMRSYCNAVGIEFLDSMLNWTDDPHKTFGSDDWCQLWFKQAMENNTFNASVLAEPEKEASLPDIVYKTIEENMESYHKLREFCLTPV